MTRGARLPLRPAVKEAVRIQKELSGRLILKDAPGPVRTIAGCDVSIYGRKACGQACLFSYPRLDFIEEACAQTNIEFPYVPGLLSFREAPVLLEAIGNLKTAPDLFIFDGQGIAHPRRMGIASHMGIILGKPSIGCAKTRLCGVCDEPGRDKGDFSPLFDDEGDIIGAVLRTRKNVKPVFVSQGNMISLGRALDIVLSSCVKYRIPEPLRAAHKYAKQNFLNANPPQTPA